MTDPSDDTIISQADEIQERVKQPDLDESDKQYIKEVMSNIKSVMWQKK